MDDEFAGLAPFSQVDPDQIEITEDGVARAFVQHHGSVARYDHDLRRWFLWTGSRWARDDTRAALEWCRRLGREASSAAKESVQRRVRSAAFAGGVERLAQVDPAIAVTSQAWDGDGLLLGCPGGVTVDLRDGKSRAADPGDGITKQCGVAPEPGPCPKWMGFLMEATGGDEDVIRFLQLWFGYTLTGLTVEHKLLFIFGPGGNGKSVLLNVLLRLLGDYAATAPMETFVAARGERHPADLAFLRGARLVTATETEEGRAWAESRIKALTGGDPITARVMRGDFFTYTPQFKLAVAGNHQPVLRNVDAAARRRFLILPFTRVPSRPDPELEDKLWSEAPQILNWAILGALEWADEGLPLPNAIAAAGAEYFADQDLFGQFIEEHAEIGNALDTTPAGDLFSAWKSFAEEAGERPGTQKALAARLRRLGLVSDRATVDGVTSRVWRGIKIRGTAR